jgi:hypothetical protein
MGGRMLEASRRFWSKHIAISDSGITRSSINQELNMAEDAAHALEIELSMRGWQLSRMASRYRFRYTSSHGSFRVTPDGRRDRCLSQAGE